MTSRAPIYQLYNYTATVYLQDPAVWTGMKARLKRPPSHEIRDVYDGLAYKEHQHFLNSGPNHLLHS